jgi:hypothetical protein
MKNCFTRLALLLAFPLLSWAQTPSTAASPTSLPCRTCSFTEAIDRRIAAVDPTGDNPLCCNFADLATPLLPIDADSGTQEPASLDPKTLGWSAWTTDYRILHMYLFNSKFEQEHGSFEPRYKKPVRLPSATGRQLFIAGGYDPVLLLEFEGERFRFIILNAEGGENGPVAAGVSHRFYPHPEGDLLVLTNTDGSLGAGGRMGEVTTWLSVVDISHDTWLLDTVVDDFSSYERPTASASGTQEVKRVYQVSNEGRTVLLGAYSFKGSPRQYAKLPPLKLDQPPAKRDLPAGTYHLLDGRYQRVPAQVSRTVTSTSAPAASHRAAVGAAEVNGTFRDAQGHELAILAVGGGKLRVAFRAGSAAAAGWAWLSQGRIQADSALVVPGPSLPCPLALRFVQAGVLQVRERGGNCATGTRSTLMTTIYHKVSSSKPLFQ